MRREHPCLKPNECATCELLAEIDSLRDALDQSVKLQSHYASLLNMYDGGTRIIFVTADDWLARLEGLKA